jgi:hypothetical protein
MPTKPITTIPVTIPIIQRGILPSDSLKEWFLTKDSTTINICPKLKRILLKI